ncbi:hypothetical protein SQ03_14570 [Methylobacterium platani JCM 14648]|uniref:Uncharacterized protein n=3 Tax=Methylobacterium platani TaxID=427683 RepID=A0A179SKB7_9HYPH|nr:hypothetical protein SQ03_14570 [Methylobacterium platani JCM 14648]OAS27461.1 hypothetical protein A5481_01480 [Methylobacterium platani]
MYWETEGFRAVAWMAAMAHNSGMVGYSEEEYAGAASHVFFYLAGAMRRQDDDFRDAYRCITAAVLAGQPEGEEAFHG